MALRQEIRVPGDVYAGVETILITTPNGDWVMPAQHAQALAHDVFAALDLIRDRMHLADDEDNQ